MYQYKSHNAVLADPICSLQFPTVSNWCHIKCSCLTTNTIQVITKVSLNLNQNPVFTLLKMFYKSKLRNLLSVNLLTIL